MTIELNEFGLAVEWPSLVSVPGCKVSRPSEIEMAEEDWQKLDASGFASEPLVQMAAWMFGPECTVLEPRRRGRENDHRRTKERGPSQPNSPKQHESVTSPPGVCTRGRRRKGAPQQKRCRVC